jgi:Tfp pilus assembly protein PilV
VPARNSQSGFTLAEVLAALLFMAIVVPVAIEGLHIAGLAGAVAERKGEAARIAQRVLTENLVTTNWSQSVQNGTTIDGQRQFRWTLRTDQWRQDPAQTAMRQLSVQVEFTAQDRKYYVNMTTLVDSSQLMGGVTSTR